VTSVSFDNISLHFPILHVGHRSFKKTILSTATGGIILNDSYHVPVVQALKDVSGHFVAGDRVGIIGANGAGKSTLLRTLAGIYEPDDGAVHVEGRIMALLDIGLGFNLNMTGRENIRMQGMFFGCKPAELVSLSAEIEEFTELGEYLDLPVLTYSSGMQMRLSLGVATALRPDILLMDEWVLTGDAAFLVKAQARLENFVARAPILMLASHSEAIVRQWCNRAIYLKGGRLRFVGEVDEAYREYNNDIRASG
jgi:ABC-2 type transport system ATP-binding protein/lipopolysaccharide transport system ATP-binding protein